MKNNLREKLLYCKKFWKSPLKTKSKNCKETMKGLVEHLDKEDKGGGR